MRNLCFLTLAMTLFAGCSGPDETPATIYLNVERDPAGDENRSETTVSFHPPSQAEIVVEVEGQRSVLLFDANNPHGEMPSKVTLAATRQESPEEGKSRVETLIRPETPNGGSAGGPSTFTVEKEKPLREVLNVSVVEGEFPFDQPIRLGTLNGEPVTLTIHPVAD